MPSPRADPAPFGGVCKALLPKQIGAGHQPASLLADRGLAARMRRESSQIIYAVAYIQRA